MFAGKLLCAETNHPFWTQCHCERRVRHWESLESEFDARTLWERGHAESHLGQPDGYGIFVIMANIHLAYQPSPFDHSQGAYTTLLAPSPRILIGSLLAFFISQQCDRKLFSTLKSRFPQLSPVGRSMITLTCSQALDTVLFSLFALYGLLDAIGEMMLFSFMVKCIAIAAMLPSALLTQKREQPNVHAS